MPASPATVDHDRVSLGQSLGSLTEPGDPAGILVPHDQRDAMRRHAPVLLMQIGVTHTCGGDLNQHLPWPWMRGGHLLDTQRLPDGVQHRSPHLVLPYTLCSERLYESIALDPRASSHTAESARCADCGFCWPGWRRTSRSGLLGLGPSQQSAAPLSRPTARCPSSLPALTPDRAWSGTLSCDDCRRRTACWPMRRTCTAPPAC